MIFPDWIDQGCLNSSGPVKGRTEGRLLTILGALLHAHSMHFLVSPLHLGAANRTFAPCTVLLPLAACLTTGAASMFLELHHLLLCAGYVNVGSQIIIAEQRLLGRPMKGDTDSRRSVKRKVYTLLSVAYDRP